MGQLRQEVACQILSPAADSVETELTHETSLMFACHPGTRELNVHIHPQTKQRNSLEGLASIKKYQVAIGSL